MFVVLLELVVGVEVQDCDVLVLDDEADERPAALALVPGPCELALGWLLVVGGELLGVVAWATARLRTRAEALARTREIRMGHSCGSGCAGRVALRRGSCRSGAEGLSRICMNDVKQPPCQCIFIG
jgi:hypothetical protein